MLTAFWAVHLGAEGYIYAVGSVFALVFWLWLATVGNPSLIGGIFPAPIVYLLRDLSELAPELARDVRRGEIPAWLVLSPEQRATFAQWTGARPDVAARLERAARAPEEEKVREAWPLLKLVYCWNTSTAALYVPELKRRLGPDVAVRDAIYAACEGWCSIPMGEEEPGGALSITSHYFEFIEESAFERGDRTAIPALCGPCDLSCSDVALWPQLFGR